MSEKSIGGPSAEEMKTPEQREREKAAVLAVVSKRLGIPRVGEEDQNQVIAEKYAIDVSARVSAEGVTIPETVNLSGEEDRLILCALSDVQGERTLANIEQVMATILDGKMYNIKLKPDNERRQQLITLAYIYAKVSERIDEGWDISMFTAEEIAASERGEYPTEEDL
jgi:hypothetical protein